MNRLTDGERVVAVVARFDDEPFVLQVVAEQPGDRLVVFDDQDALGHLQTSFGHAHALRRRPIGSVTSTSVPDADGAAHLDPAAMALDDAFRDRQAEAAAADGDVAAPIEAFEDAREVLAGDSGPPIPDGQRDALGGGRARHGQVLLGRRVLDRVVHDVVERLNHRRPIDADLREIGRHVDDQIELQVGQHRPQSLQRVLDQIGRLDVGELGRRRRMGAAVARVGQEVVDRAAETGRFHRQQAGVLLHGLGRGVAAVGEGVADEPDECHGRLQLVRHRGDEIGFHRRQRRARPVGADRQDERQQTRAGRDRNQEEHPPRALERREERLIRQRPDVHRPLADSRRARRDRLDERRIDEEERESRVQVAGAVGLDRRRLRHDPALVVGHRNREAAAAPADLLDLFHQRIEILRVQPLLIDREGHESQECVGRAGREERVRDDLVGRPVDGLLQHDERRRRRRMLPDGRDESGQRGRVADQHHRERVVRRGPRLPRRRAIRAVEHVGRPVRPARCASTARRTRDTGTARRCARRPGTCCTADLRPGWWC